MLTLSACAGSAVGRRRRVPPEGQALQPDAPAGRRAGQHAGGPLPGCPRLGCGEHQQPLTREWVRDESSGDEDRAANPVVDRPAGDGDQQVSRQGRRRSGPARRRCACRPPSICRTANAGATSRAPDGVIVAPVAGAQTQIDIHWSQDPQELRGAIAVRTEVFCVEQGVPVEEEIDGRDDEAAHLVASTTAGSSRRCGCSSTAIRRKSAGSRCCRTGAGAGSRSGCWRSRSTGARERRLRASVPRVTALRDRAL